MLEANNFLASNSVVWTKYVKPPHLHSATQRNTHIIIGLSNKNNANKIIQRGLYIEGKHVVVWKNIITPRRCLKCQHFGHYASECKATTDTCVLCTLDCCTNLCPTPDTPPQVCQLHRKPQQWTWISRQRLPIPPVWDSQDPPMQSWKQVQVLPD